MLRIITANTFNKKLKGLIGQKSINYGMFFPNVKSIHTFLMKEPIDIIGLNQNNQVVEIYPNVKPNRIIFLHNSKHTLELPNNYSKNIHLGDIINKDIIK
jgi:uncharacterized protein